jgi:hypothetical protein
VTRRERRERRQEALRERRRARGRAAVAPLCLLLGGALLLAGLAMGLAPPPSAASPASGVPLASVTTMAALEAGSQPDPSPRDRRGRRVLDASPAAVAPVMPALPVAPSVAPSVQLPVAVAIPRIGVEAPLSALGLDDDGRLEVPAEPELAGWYELGPRPGEPGAAVIAGHVDSRRGPAVFHRLAELAPGDEVLVHGEDGTSTRFLVQRLERWPKNAFPTDAVYRDASGAELRLITCGGLFDRDRRRYEDNVIVFASAAPSPAASTPTAAAPKPR